MNGEPGKGSAGRAEVFLIRIHLIGLFAILVAVGCASAPNGPSPVAPSQLLLRLASNTATESAKIPKRVYIFPPLRCDAEGRPEQSYTQGVREDGSIDWLPPDEKSREWLALLGSLFASRGYEIVPYSAVLQSAEAHSVLVVSAYYSRPYRIGGDDGAAYSLFTRLAGDTYPLDLDSSLKRTVFNQIATGFFLDRSSADGVPPLAYRTAISAIGFSGLRKVRLPLRLPTDGPR